MSNNSKLIVANWKMYKNLESSKDFFLKFPKESYDNLIICPPFTLLDPLSRQGGFKLGAQDCSAFSSSEGSFTGDISAQMLKNLTCEYVIIGHSERRNYHNEKNEIIKQKVANAHLQSLTCILCIGESLELRETGEYKDALLEDLYEVISPSCIESNLIIAYEPIWAIGNGKTASIEQIEEMHEFLYKNLLSRFAISYKILYGGSVNIENAKSILDISRVDGLLVGGASLDPENFYKIIKMTK
ncbi:MAG: triose-phosphate isomerase [Pseudomonadota bacterium]